MARAKVVPQSGDLDRRPAMLAVNPEPPRSRVPQIAEIPTGHGGSSPPDRHKGSGAEEAAALGLGWSLRQGYLPTPMESRRF